MDEIFVGVIALFCFLGGAYTMNYASDQYMIRHCAAEGTVKASGVTVKCEIIKESAK